MVSCAVSRGNISSPADLSGRNMPVVTIRMAKGRTIDQKRVIVKEITETIVSTLNVDPSWVTVLIEEFDKDCIGKSGKLLCES